MRCLIIFVNVCALNVNTCTVKRSLWDSDEYRFGPNMQVLPTINPVVPSFFVFCSHHQPSLCFSQESQKPVWKYRNMYLSSPVSQIYWTALASCFLFLLASSSFCSGESVTFLGTGVGASGGRKTGHKNEMNEEKKKGQTRAGRIKEVKEVRRGEGLLLLEK